MATPNHEDNRAEALVKTDLRSADCREFAGNVRCPIEQLGAHEHPTSNTQDCKSFSTLNPRIRVGIIDPDHVQRTQLMKAIDASSRLRLVGSYSNAHTALSNLCVLKPSVCLIASDLASVPLLDCVRHVQAMLPVTRVLILGAPHEAPNILFALASGAAGYLIKENDMARLPEAIIDVHEKGCALCPAAAAALVAILRQLWFHGQSFEQLTDREREVFIFWGMGCGRKDIGKALGIETDTVRTHLGSVYRKLNLHSRRDARTQLKAYAPQ